MKVIIDTPIWSIALRRHKKHNLKIVTIKDLIEYRMRNESLVRESAVTKIPTEFGVFDAIAFENSLDHHSHLALIKGPVKTGDPVLVRVHSQCVTGDVFGSYRCDCGEQLSKALEMISKEKAGVLL